MQPEDVVDKNKKEILIIAAEASSCAYALKLMQELRILDSSLTFYGVGNSEMERSGFHCLGKAEEMALLS